MFCLVKLEKSVVFFVISCQNLKNSILNSGYLASQKSWQPWASHPTVSRWPEGPRSHSLTRFHSPMSPVCPRGWLDLHTYLWHPNGKILVNPLSFIFQFGISGWKAENVFFLDNTPGLLYVMGQSPGAGWAHERCLAFPMNSAFARPNQVAEFKDSRYPGLVQAVPILWRRCGSKVSLYISSLGQWIFPET